MPDRVSLIYTRLKYLLCLISALGNLSFSERDCLSWWMMANGSMTMSDSKILGCSICSSCPSLQEEIFYTVTGVCLIHNGKLITVSFP